MFSLLDDPWILVDDSDGSQKLVGIRQLFSGEVKATAVRGDSPAQDYAITRLLLAIFWRAHAPESIPQPGKTFKFPDWWSRTRRQLQSRGKDKAVLSYLDTYADRFELFHDSAPFMQVAGLRVASGEFKHVTMIMPEAQEDFFSMRAGKARDSLSFAEAARWLVYCQAFDYSGIKSGAVGDARAKGGKGYPIGTGWSGMTGGTLVIGDNLLDTLVLNTPLASLSNPNDKPVWEREPDGPGERSTVGEATVPQGPADLATWQSRRIRLRVEQDRVTGVVLSNGDKIPDAGANQLDDPMTPYRFSANKSKKDKDVYYPRPYDVTRTMWRALDSLVVAETDQDFSEKEKAPKRPQTLTSLAQLSAEVEGIPKVLNLELVSVAYGPQASSIATTYSSTMSMPLIVLVQESAALRSTVRSAGQQTMQAAVALGQFGGNLDVAAGGEYEFDGTSTDKVLAGLEPRFNAWLSSLAGIEPSNGADMSARIEDFHATWQKTVREVIDAYAKIMLRGAGPKAFAGRLMFRDETDTQGRFVSAASYLQLLQRKLDSVLPATARNARNAQTQTHKEESQ